MNVFNNRTLLRFFIATVIPLFCLYVYTDSSSEPARVVTSKKQNYGSVAISNTHVSDRANVLITIDNYYDPKPKGYCDGDLPQDFYKHELVRDTAQLTNFLYGISAEGNFQTNAARILEILQDQTHSIAKVACFKDLMVDAGHHNHMNGTVFFLRVGSKYFLTTNAHVADFLEKYHIENSSFTFYPKKIFTYVTGKDLAYVQISSDLMRELSIRYLELSSDPLPNTLYLFGTNTSPRGNVYVVNLTFNKQCIRPIDNNGLREQYTFALPYATYMHGMSGSPIIANGKVFGIFRAVDVCSLLGFFNTVTVADFQ